jgi:hypothetical protein
MEIKSINFPNGKRVLQREHFLQGAVPAKRVGRFASGAIPEFRSTKSGLTICLLHRWLARDWQPVFNNGDHNEKSFDRVNTRLSVHHLYHVLRAKFSEELRQW